MEYRPFVILSAHRILLSSDPKTDSLADTNYEILLFCSHLSPVVLLDWQIISYLCVENMIIVLISTEGNLIIVLIITEGIVLTSE